MLAAQRPAMELPLAAHGGLTPMTSALPRLRLAVFSYGLPNPVEKRGGIERVAHESG